MSAAALKVASLYMHRNSPDGAKELKSSFELAASNTYEFPFATRLIGRQVDRRAIFRRQFRQIDLITVISPRAKLQCAVLVIEREPLDVDRTGGDVEPERNPRA